MTYEMSRVLVSRLAANVCSHSTTGTKLGGATRGGRPECVSLSTLSPWSPPVTRASSVDTAGEGLRTTSEDRDFVLVVL
jgi:hypothetical protein